MRRKGTKVRIPRPKPPTVPLSTTEYPPPKIALFQRMIPAKDWAQGGEWAFVISSWVERIRYEKKSNELFIDFLDGFSYAYFGIGDQVARDMYGANSMGKFIHIRLKGKHQGREVPRNPFLFIHGRMPIQQQGY